MKTATPKAEARAAREAMSAVRTTVLVMTVATVGAMVMAMAVVSMLSTVVAASLATWH